LAALQRVTDRLRRQSAFSRKRKPLQKTCTTACKFNTQSKRTCHDIR